jgi:hypothetical protein
MMSVSYPGTSPRPNINGASVHQDGLPPVAVFDILVFICSMNISPE